MNTFFNVLTRVMRFEAFKVCRQSVKDQDYFVRHIVASEKKCKGAKPLTKKYVTGEQPYGTLPAHYNLHLNEMGKWVKGGWVMYLDDDDMFTRPDAVRIILSHAKSKNDLILWQVDINGRIVPAQVGRIELNDISGIGFCFHSKHLPVDWGCWTGGDYRVISELAKKLNPIWINLVLTRTQGQPNRGKV